MVDVQVRGADKIIDVFQKLPKEFRKNVLRGMLKAGAKVLLDEAKANVPVDTGNLKESLSVIPRKSKDKNIVVYAVTPLRNKTKTKRFKTNDGTKWSITGQVADGFYAHMVEFGTKNMSAHPFLRPIETKADESYEAGRKYVKERVSKLLKDIS